MKNGSYKIARQSVSGAVYAEVAVAVKPAEESAFTVGFLPDVPHYFREAAAAGVRYAHLHWMVSGRGQTAPVTVVVTSVKETPVDTTEPAVFFAAYQATCRGLEMEPDERVRFRPDLVFEFPNVAGR